MPALSPTVPFFPSAVNDQVSLGGEVAGGRASSLQKVRATWERRWRAMMKLGQVEERLLPQLDWLRELDPKAGQSHVLQCGHRA